MNESGIIFVDVARDVTEKIGKKKPNLKNKYLIVFVLTLMVLTSFTTINFMLPSASANTLSYTYPITITGAPTGTGYYQQLINVSNPSHYGINTAGSNVMFAASNGTQEYAWIQSINSTVMQVWVKAYNGSSQIDMQVFPQFENLFSATGHIGEAPQLSTVYNASNNMLNVFKYAFAFSNHISNFWDYNSTTQSVNGIVADDGLKWFVNSLTTENVFITRHSNISNYNFGFTVSSYSNGSILANFWTGTNSYGSGATTISSIGNYLISNLANGNIPILDNNGHNPTYMTIPDIFFYVNVTMPTTSIGAGSVLVPPSTATNNIYINGTYDSTNTYEISSGTVGLINSSTIYGQVNLWSTSTGKTGTASWTIPSGTIAEKFYWSYISQTGNVSSSLARGIYSSSLPTSVTFTYNYVPNGNITHGYGYYSVVSYFPVTKTVSWTIPADTYSETFSLSSTSGSVSSSLTSGTYYAPFPTSTTFTYDGYVEAYATYSVTGTAASSESFASGAISMTITQNQDWWNSTVASYLLSIPSGYTLGAYTISHVLSVGYANGVPFDSIYYNGSNSGYINPKQQYSSITAYGGTVVNGNTYINFTTQELLNYNPIIVSDSVHFSGTGSTADINLHAEEVLAPTQYVSISWGDGGGNTSPYQSGVWFNYSHQYTSSGDYRVTATVYNQPDAPTGSLSASQTVLYNITISTSFTPITNSILYTSSVATILLSTDGNVLFSNVTINVNGAVYYPSFSYSGNTLTASYTLPGSGSINYRLIWTLKGGGIVQSYTIYYYAPRTPGEYSNWLGMSYANGVPPPGMEFAIPVTVTNNQGISTNASMPELLYVDWSTYQTYLAPTLSNIEFFTTNFVPLYAWIENNATSTATASNVWVNLGNDIIPAHSSITIYIGIFHTSTDNFGINAYLGLAPWLTSTYGQADNGNHVFSDYWNFSGSSLPSGFVAGSATGKSGGGTYYVHNGIYINGTDSLIGEYEVMYNQPITLSNYVVDSINMNPINDGNTSYMITNGQLPSSSATNSEGLQIQYVSNTQQTASGGYCNGTTIADSITTSITWNLPDIGDWMLSDYVAGSTPFHSSNVFSDANSIAYTLSYTHNWSAPSGIGKIGYIGLGEIEGDYSNHFLFLDARVAPPNNVMPSSSYSSAVPTSTFVTLRYPFEVVTSDPSNNTLSIYTYTIIKASNSPTVYLYYNSSWQLNSLTSNSYTMLPGDCIQIDNLTEVTTIYATFVEPSRIANPYATIILNLIPSVAVGQVSGIFLPVSYMAVYINGQELYSNSYQDAVIGNNYTITVKDAFLISILTKTVVPTSQNFPVFLYLNLSEITWRNMNQNSSINIYASQNGFTQQEIAVGADSISPVFYFLDGTYNFTYDFETYSVVNGVNLGAGVYKTITASVQMNGLMSQIFYGYSLLQVAQEINTTAKNITNSISQIYINLYLQGESVQNLTLALMLNLSIENSSIHNTLLTLLNNITFLQDALGNTNTSLTTKVNFIDSLLNSTAISIANKINVVESVLNSTTISLSTKINFVDSLLNSTTLSLTSKLNFINSVLNSTTVSLSDKINFVDSVLNSTTISLTTKINFVDSIINSTTLSLTDKINFVDSTLNSTTVSLTTKINFVDSLLNSTQISLATKINFISSLLNSTNVSITTKLNVLSSSLTDLNLSVKQEFNLLNATLKSINVSIDSKITLLNTTLSNMNVSLNTKISLINTILTDMNVSLNTKIALINTALNSLNLSLNNKIALINTAIINMNVSLNDKITIINSVLSNMNISLGTKIAFVNATLNNLNLSLKTKLDFMWSALNNTNISVAAKVNILNSSLHDLNLSMKQDFALLNSTLNSLNTSIKTQVNMIMNSINSSKLNITTKITTVEGFLSFVMGKQNASSIDKIEFMDPQVVGNNTYRFTVDVFTPSGAPVNLSATQYVANNMILKFVQGYKDGPLAYSISNIQPGSFVITIFGLNYSDINALNSNNAVVTASSNTSSNSDANAVALGLLGSFLANNQWQHTLLILFQPIVWRVSAMDVLLLLISVYAFLVVSRFMRQSKAGRKKAWLNAKYHLFLWSITFLAWFLMYAAYRGGML